MGLSASQGRMLLLTARKNDLEFRAQQISQKRLILAQQLEEVAMDYEEATSNRQMKISLTYTGTGNAESINKTSNLTYAALISGIFGIDEVDRGIVSLGSGSTSGFTNRQDDYASSSAYRLCDAYGSIVVADKAEISTKYMKTTTDENGKKKTEPVEGVLKQRADGKYYIAASESEDTDVGAHTFVVDSALKYGTTDASGLTTGPNYLQDALRNGKYLLQKAVASAETDNAYKWSNLSWDATSNIMDSYYTEDDDKAKAKYDRVQTQIQNQDKKLELELDNIETQRSAVTTEVESVQKVIDDNIQDSFKAFA